MKDEFEKKEADNGNNPNSDGDNDKKTQGKSVGDSRGFYVILVSVVAFVVLYAIVNISNISSVASEIVSVLNPIILGFGFAYLLNPVLNFFERKAYKKIRNKKLLRVLSLISTYVVSVLFLTAVIFLVIPQLIESAIILVSSFDEYIDNTINLINGLIGRYLDTHTVPVINREHLLDFISKLFTTSGDFFQSVGSYVMKYGAGLVVGVKNFVFAVFISIYVLVTKENLKAQAKKLTTAFMRTESKQKLYRYVGLCNKTFGGFLVGKIVDSLIIGLITLVTLFFFKMPFYVLVAAIVCVTNVIPIFGPFIGAIPSFFIIFIVDPAKAFLFLVLILIIQQIDGNIIGPKILGSSTGMSSLGVMVAILIMGEWLGVIGMILGVPIFAVILAIINELAEHRLRKKDLPVNTAEYYAADSLVDPYARHETLSHRFFSLAGHLFGRIFKAIFKNNKRKAATETEADDNGEGNNTEQERQDNENE